jgi:hypothetical protein
MKITELTDEQKVALVAHRKRYFDLATTTEPADRPKAEAAVRALAELAGVKVNRVVWVSNPHDGKRTYDKEWDSLGASLGDSLWASLRASLGASLWDSLGASLGDTGWMAFYAAPRDLLGVVYAQDASHKLDLWIATLESCFALWLVPGVAILCERPATVEIVDDRLVGMTWRKSVN